MEVTREELLDLEQRIEELEKFNTTRGSEIDEAKRLIGHLAQLVSDASKLLTSVLEEKGCNADPRITSWLGHPLVGHARALPQVKLKYPGASAPSDAHSPESPEAQSDPGPNRSSREG